MCDDLVNYLRSLQTEPNTIFVGFNPTSKFAQADRDKYLREMRDGNPGRPIVVLEVGNLLGNEIMVC